MMSAICPQFAPDGARLALGSKALDANFRPAHSRGFVGGDDCNRTFKGGPWKEISIVSAVTGQLECTLGPFCLPSFEWTRDAQRLTILEFEPDTRRARGLKLSIACALSGTVLQSDMLGTEPTCADPDCFSPCGRYALVHEMDVPRKRLIKPRVIDTASRQSVWQMHLVDIRHWKTPWRHVWHPHDSAMALFDFEAFAVKVVSLAEGATILDLDLEPVAQRAGTTRLQVQAGDVGFGHVIFMAGVLVCTFYRPSWYCGPQFAVVAINAGSQQVLACTDLDRPAVDMAPLSQCAPTASLFAVSTIEIAGQGDAASMMRRRCVCASRLLQTILYAPACVPGRLPGPQTVVGSFSTCPAVLSILCR